MKEAVNPYQAPLFMDAPVDEVVKDGVLVKIKSVSLRAGFTLGFLGLSMLVQVTVLVMALNLVEFPEEGGMSYPRIFALGGLLRIIYLIWFLMWTYRSAQNARMLEGELPDISPGMSVGSYFIPFYNLVGPFLAMRKITGVISRVSKRPLVWAGAWWTLCLLPGIVGAILGAVGGAEWVIPVINLVPVAATAVFVIRLTRQQMFLYRNPPRIPLLGGSPRRHSHVTGIPNGLPLPHPKRPRLPVVARSRSGDA